mmetsp:Transcript_146195/g.453058  ORF Transcript_146195/g.453058 Transcript_146195/m.453058 type:complete len:84 (+) Transcript_146195:186-437(+)
MEKLSARAAELRSVSIEWSEELWEACDWLLMDEPLLPEFSELYALGSTPLPVDAREAGASQFPVLPVEGIDIGPTASCRIMLP